ncbi:MAG TPA: cytochrome d ubiquinol oxidase subunit II, partial [Thermoleophilaceae bacterium]|nr:cytochrome d ubiquinol oxidase subunit II [Thermoleophilaceae bacterium]
RALGATFAFSSVLVPFFLGASAGAIAAGEVPVGNAAGDEWASWTGAVPILVGLVAVATGAHLAAVFLGADSHRAGRPELVNAFRVRALGSGVVAGALAIAGLAVVSSEAPRLYDGLSSGVGLACVIVSALAGVATLALEWRERFEPARYTAAAAVGSIVAGWGFAQEPYLLPPQLTLEEAAASDATLTALVIAAIAGMALLVPALIWLFRLALSGRLAYEDEPRP